MCNFITIYKDLCYNEKLYWKILGCSSIYLLSLTEKTPRKKVTTSEYWSRITSAGNSFRGGNFFQLYISWDSRSLLKMSWKNVILKIADFFSLVHILKMIRSKSKKHQIRMPWKTAKKKRKNTSMAAPILGFSHPFKLLEAKALQHSTQQRFPDGPTTWPSGGAS